MVRRCRARKLPREKVIERLINHAHKEFALLSAAQKAKVERWRAACSDDIFVGSQVRFLRTCGTGRAGVGIVQWARPTNWRHKRTKMWVGVRGSFGHMVAVPVERCCKIKAPQKPKQSRAAVTTRKKVPTAAIPRKKAPKMPKKSTSMGAKVCLKLKRADRFERPCSQGQRALNKLLADTAAAE